MRNYLIFYSVNKSSRAAFLPGLAVLFSLACTPPKQVSGPCHSDSQCEEYRFCDEASGLCLCSDDRACSDGEFCNAAFMCQAQTGCLDNSDCDNSTFCDVKSGQCISDLQCTMNTHCAFNQVCDKSLQRCVEGCRDEGDCVLGMACIGAADGALGTCVEGLCRSTDMCDTQEICDPATGRCVLDQRGPYCGPCQNLWTAEECGGRANYCLVDTSDPSGGSYYCGVDSSQGQPCPAGYEKHNVIILPPAAPLCRTAICADGLCSGNGGSCEVDEDCPYALPGGDCARAVIGNCRDAENKSCASDDECCETPPCDEGLCVRQECRGGEGDALGHCTCTRDLDCPTDSCVDADLSDPDNPVLGYCMIGGHDCYEDIDCDVITCIDGGCRIGQNCAPANDQTCADLRHE